MRSYARFDGAALGHSVGTNGKGGYRIGDGTAGYLSHGPYVGLATGHYTAGFYVRRRGDFDLGFVHVDVCCNNAGRTLGSRQIAASEILTELPGWLKIDFFVDQDIADAEVRFQVPEYLVVEIRELVIFKRDPTSWGVE